MKFLKALSLLALFTTSIALSHADTSQYNLTNGNLALTGYDPVAYHPEGGGVPAKGQRSISTVYKKVLYYFSSASNLDTFNSNPEKYRPTYGGWCAFAMASGKKVNPSVTRFDIQNGRLLLFIPGTKDPWTNNRRAFTRRANRAWKKISGESTIFSTK